METPIYTKHTLEELVNSYSEVKGDAEFVNYFIEQYNQAFDDFIGDDEEDDIPSVRALKFCFKYYLPIFLEQLQKGHSAKWAHEFTFSCEEEESIINSNFHEIKKIDPLWAQNELIILCKSKGITDPMQVNYFIYLIDEGGMLYERAIQRSAAYLDIFKSELAKGKSFLCSQIYAKEKASDYNNDTYCRAYAWAFEQTVLKNKSENFRINFLHEFAEVIDENYSDFEEALKDDDFSIFINPIIAAAQASDYINNHEVENSQKFISLYVDIFVNSDFLYQSPFLQIDKDIDEEVLTLTLDKMGK